MASTGGGDQSFAPQSSASQSAASYEFVRAPRTLGAMVASTVGYRSEGAVPQLHRGLPAPYLTLIFSLDGPVVGGESPEHARGADAYREEIVVGGLRQSPAYILQPDREAGVQLAVHPLAARALFGMPARELTHTAGPGASVLGRAAVEIHERMRELDGWESRFGLLTDYLRKRSQEQGRRAEVRPEVAEAWRWMAERRGAGSLDAMARHVALSRRQLTTLFQREVGAGPKQISRLMRFEAAKQQVTSAVAGGAPPDLSAVAARCGFCDHSHLVRDFRQYTGLSPSRWISEERRNIQAGGHRNGEE
jgi:AraC-like DNA-binding protein